jgi:hypothetical protein
MESPKVHRRRFLKYVGAGLVAAGAAGAAASAYYFSRSARTPTPIPTETTTFALASSRSYATASSSTATRSSTMSRQGYPLLGNYDHWTYSIRPEEVEHFARWNVLALNFETAAYAPTALKMIRSLNPSIKILAWISLGLWAPYAISPGSLTEAFLKASTEDWWIHKQGTVDPSERRLQMVPWYPGLVTPNPRSEFGDHIVKFLQEAVVSTDLYDGVFYDCLWDDGWLSQQLANTDISPSDYWEGITNILRNTREKFGPNFMILGNPGVEWRDSSPYWQYANGHYQENALGDVFGSNWSKMWEIYYRNIRKPSPPTRFHWIGVDTQYKRERSTFQNVTQLDLTEDDLRRMRLGLGTTLLLDNGFFGFDKGDGWHGYGEQWWFSEYDVNLGMPKGNHETASDGTYRRRYDNGIVIVNSGSKKIIDLDARYRDATTNEIVNQITIPREDARILVKI